MKKGSYKIPFVRTKDGPLAMMEYTVSEEGEIKKAGQPEWHVPDLWVDNYEFDATVELDGIYRGRSAARVKCHDIKTGNVYSLGFAAFFEAITKFGVTPGPMCASISGKWTFRKQGANYGLYPVV